VDDVALGQLQLVGLGLGQLDVCVTAVRKVELDAHLEAEVDHARHLRLRRPGLRQRRDLQVMRTHQLGSEPRDGAEEAHDEAVRRALVKVPRRAHLLDVAVVHDGDPVGDVHRLLLVVRDEHGGDVNLVVQPPQPRAQLCAHLGVQRAERLVEQQHARLDGERTRQRHALTLAAAELRRVPVRVAGQPDDREQLLHARVYLGLRPLAHAQPERDVLAHGHVLERGVVLEDEPDPALLGRQRRRIAAVDHDRAGIGNLESRDDAQQRRLARARRPEQRRQRARGDLERDAVQRLEVAEALGDVGRGDHAGSLRGLMSVIASSVARAMTASSADAA
jgi:hypothetical protein